MNRFQLSEIECLILIHWSQIGKLRRLYENNDAKSKDDIALLKIVFNMMIT